MTAVRKALIGCLAATPAFVAACGTSSAPESVPAEKPRVFIARPLRDITVPRTPARVARGKYLSEGLLQCFVCHSERDWTQPGAPPIAATRGAGAVWPGRPWLVAPNLTPDAETGIGRWTDDMLLRAMREGISHDGRVLHRQMWYASFRILPDEDAEAIVAYLRSLAPIRHALPATSIPVEEAARLKVPEPITTPVVAMSSVDSIQRGRRLAELADCAGCHTSWYTPTNPGLFGGGNLVERGPPKAYGANITSDPSGIAYYDDAFFREVMRTGRAKSRELSPVMPWTVFKNLNDEDLSALFAYLRAIPPVTHRINNSDPPTLCAACGGTHPLGQYNKARVRTLVPVDISALRDATGTYRFDDGFKIRLNVERGKASLNFPDNNSCAVVTEDNRFFQCDDSAEDRLEFIRDPAGTVTHAVNNGVSIGRKVKG